MALEAQLVISADDRTAAAFASVEGRISAIQAALARVNAVAPGVSMAEGAVRGLGPFAPAGAALAEHADALAAQAAAADRAAAATKRATEASNAASGSLGSAAKTAGLFATVSAIIEGVKDTVLAGADLQTELVKLQNAGIVGAEWDEAQKQALALSARYPNVGQVEALEEYRAVRSVAGKPEEVPGLMPTVIAAFSAMKLQGVDVGAMPNLYKAAETLGQTRDPEKFRRFIDQFLKMQQFAGHTMRPEDVQKFAQQMKLSGAVVSDEFIELDDVPPDAGDRLARRRGPGRPIEDLLGARVQEGGRRVAKARLPRRTGRALREKRRGGGHQARP